MWAVNSFPLSARKVCGIPPALFTQVFNTAELTSLALLFGRGVTITKHENPSNMVNKYLAELIFDEIGPTESMYTISPCSWDILCMCSTLLLQACCTLEDNFFYVLSHVFPHKLICDCFCSLVIPQCALVWASTRIANNFTPLSYCNNLSLPNIISGWRVGGQASVKSPPNQLNTSWHTGSFCWAVNRLLESVTPSDIARGSWTKPYLTAS